MPQEHYVLKCFSCESFQAHIVKKSKKWECKICGIKQSLKRNYGKGSGKDCRTQVMRLNELRLTKNNAPNLMESEISDEFFTDDLNNQQIKEQLKVEKPLINKWTDYLEENSADKGSESDEYATDFLLDLAEKKKKRMKKKLENCYLKKRKIYEESKTNEVFIQECEEAVKKSDLLSFPTNQSIDSNKIKEQDIEKDFSNQNEHELKSSKYMKYLEDQGDEFNLKVLKKTTNIFDSGTTDLDSLLNL